MHQIPFHFSNTFSQALIEALTTTIQFALKDFAFESFAIGCAYPYSLSEDEKALLKKDFQFGLVKSLEKETSKKADFSNPTIQITIDFNAHKIRFFIQPVFIGGRYTKFSRHIAQTIFYCPKCKGKGCAHCKQKGQLGLETVEELVGKPAQQFFCARSFVFHGAGREDVDVRMLGRGREFVLELGEPRKRLADLQKLEKKINALAKRKIKVHNLELAGKKRIVELKEQRQPKKYAALVSCQKPVSESALKKLAGKEWVVAQQTPLRVVKRRSDLIRKRKIEFLVIQKKSEKKFEAVFLAEAGLYIKEFVSSDDNRTQPSLSSLLKNKCVCKQLDVLEILLLTHPF